MLLFDIAKTVISLVLIVVLVSFTVVCGLLLLILVLDVVCKKVVNLSVGPAPSLAFTSTSYVSLKGREKSGPEISRGRM